MTPEPVDEHLGEDFSVQVNDAYEHLYDLVYLRTHPLADMLISAESSSWTSKARSLHTLLRDLVDELDPGPEAPTFSSEWRRHRYMVLRYLKGLTHEAVAEQLQLGLRHYYRVRHAIVQEIADILRTKYVASQRTSNEMLDDGRDHLPDRIQMLRQEFIHLGHVQGYTNVRSAAMGVLDLLHQVLDRHEIEVVWSIDDPLPECLISPELLRQVLLGLMGFLIEHWAQTTISVSLASKGSRVVIELLVTPVEIAQTVPQDLCKERLEEIQGIAVLANCDVQPHWCGNMVSGFTVLLPPVGRTVLIVEDNEDLLRLFQEYLTDHGYTVFTATTVDDAGAKAHLLRPDIIVLDLMMRERDGWELLQTLLSNPETSNIPIVVCSVLNQRGLALAMGAAAYLQKPITGHALLSSLEQFIAA